jgi:hypothetical protein
MGTGLQALPRPAGVLLALVWGALIWQLSSLRFGDEPQVFWRSWLSNCGHAPLFGLLALWCAVALPRARGWPLLSRGWAAVIMALVLVYGVIDELHQAEVPGRDASPFDLLTDLTGAACTLWLAYHVGQPRATSGSVSLRLVVGLLLCALAGFGATLT